MSEEESLNNSADSPVSPDETESAKTDIASLQSALEEEKVKSLRYLSNWQRAEADFANFKKRTEQERNELVKFAGSSFLCALLPALDDLERALASVPPEITESQWFNGINFIQRKLITTLESQGVSEIKARGESFDPRYHEAVAQCPGDEGKVMEVTQTGYQLHDRVIRPASVIVGNGKE